MASQWPRILRDGKLLGSNEQAEALRIQARAFEAERLPVLRALGVAA